MNGQLITIPLQLVYIFIHNRAVTQLFVNIKSESRAASVPIMKLLIGCEHQMLLGQTVIDLNIFTSNNQILKYIYGDITEDMFKL